MKVCYKHIKRVVWAESVLLGGDFFLPYTLSMNAIIDHAKKKNAPGGRCQRQRLGWEPATPSSEGPEGIQNFLPVMYNYTIDLFPTDPLLLLWDYYCF